MQKSLRFFLLLVGAGISRSLSCAQVRDLGEVEIKTDIKTIAVHVSGSTPEIDQLANLAFNAHGRYRRVSSGGSFDIRFSGVAGNQVQVEITRNSMGVAVTGNTGGGRAATSASPGASALVASQVFSGTTSRNAFFRAADFAVEKTSGLKGFFASKLTFLVENRRAMEVHTSDLFLGEGHQITHDNAQAMKPRFSPDGSKILYTSFYKSGYADIFLIDLRSSQRTAFVSLVGTNMGARFSPNGQQAAMVLTGEGNAEIYVSNAQGRQISRRTRTSAIEASPCFSPDGSQLVYTSDAAGGPQLYVMSVGGGQPRRLATNISGYCAEPDWSRGNPNLIAFTAKIGGGYQIAVYDLSGRTPARVVSKAPADAVDPVWMADGRHLIYTQRAPNARRLCLLDTETGASTAISGANVQVSQASVYRP